jgi:hypothetical protein
MQKSLNVTVGNAKRFIAYEIVKKLEAAKDHALLDTLHGAVSRRERKKGQIHKIFEESFEAKECYSKGFIYQKLDYIHHNPVSGRWRLIDDFTRYEHSSASFYETGKGKYEKLIHINEIIG